jgi:hypothetical protein
MTAKLGSGQFLHPSTAASQKLTYNFLRAINRAAVHSPFFVCCILDLQPCFDMLYRSSDKAHRGASQGASDSVSESRQGTEIFRSFGEWKRLPEARFREDVFEEQTSVEC